MKIETPEQLAASLNACNEADLDGLVIIGGDDSNTNAAVVPNILSRKDVRRRSSAFQRRSMGI